MLTRRENLLIRPWQERRYIYHREKVQSALPAIDNATPPRRPHVSCKLKKMQKEVERCSQIVSDNFTLLQHLSNIMSTTRVDHFWEEPPPNFLQRVGIYKARERVPKRRVKTDVSEDDRPRTRKERCYGCSPERFQKVDIIPEERIPFCPPKRRVTRRAETPPDWQKQYQFRCSEDRPEFRGKVWKKVEKRSSVRQVDGEKPRRRRRRKRELLEESQSIYLSKGGLTLAVKFPSRTEVLLSNQRGTRVLERELCECKSFPRKLSKLGKSDGETITLQSPDKLEKEIENGTLINVLNQVASLKVSEEETNGTLSKEITVEEIPSDDENKIDEAEESLELEAEERVEDSEKYNEIESQKETVTSNGKSEDDTDNFFEQFIKEEFKETVEEYEEEEEEEDVEEEEEGESEQDLLEKESQKSVKEESEEEKVAGNPAEKEYKETEVQQSGEKTDIEETSQANIQEYLREQFEKQNSEEVDFDFWGLTEEEYVQEGNIAERETDDVLLEQKKDSKVGTVDDIMDIVRGETKNESMVITEEETKNTFSQEFQEEEADDLKESNENNISEESAKESANENVERDEEDIMEKKDVEEVIQESDDEENTNKKIEKMFESVENVIAEVNEKDWMEELDFDLVEAMKEDNQQDNEDVKRENDE